MRNSICKQFLVLTSKNKVITKSRVKNVSETVFLDEGEILLNPCDIENSRLVASCDDIEYIREIIRITKNVEFDDYEIVEKGKIIFNARLIISIEYKVSKNPCCPEFSGNIIYKVMQIPFAGFIETKNLRKHHRIELVGTVEGQIDRPKLGVPFSAINEVGGLVDNRLKRRLPGAIIILEKTIVKVYVRVVGHI